MDILDRNHSILPTIYNILLLFVMFGPFSTLLTSRLIRKPLNTPGDRERLESYIFTRKSVIRLIRFFTHGGISDTRGTDIDWEMTTPKTPVSFPIFSSKGSWCPGRIPPTLYRSPSRRKEVKNPVSGTTVRTL